MIAWVRYRVMAAALWMAKCAGPDRMFIVIGLAPPGTSEAAIKEATHDFVTTLAKRVVAERKQEEQSADLAA